MHSLVESAVFPVMATDSKDAFRATHGHAGPLPTVVMRRLPLYLNCIRQLVAEGQSWVSSRELATKLDCTSSRVRKDLNYIGRLGIAGRGYSTQVLTNRLSHAIGMGQRRNIVLIAHSDPTQLIAQCPRLEFAGFNVSALFVTGAMKRVPKSAIGVKSMSQGALDRAVQSEDIEYALVTAPEDHIQEIVDQIAITAIRAIVVFGAAPSVLPRGTRVYYLDPVLTLQTVSAELESERI